MQTLDQPRRHRRTGCAQRVTGALQCDSRRLQPGDGFVAWPGAATDGRRYVNAALASGAVAALVERDGVEAFGLDDPRVLAVPDLKSQAGAIASAFCGHPSAALDVLAITGTNGKTSCAWWTAQLLSVCARPCAVVGTLGMGQPGTPLDAHGSHHARPGDAAAAAARFVDEGLKACAIEASSIGLVEGRLNATQVRVAVFTNFTQDHLDFHGSMDAYWDAKAALFDWPGLASAVVNTDDAQGQQAGHPVGLARAGPVDRGHRIARPPERGGHPVHPRRHGASTWSSGTRRAPSWTATACRCRWWGATTCPTCCVCWPRRARWACRCSKP